MFENLRGTLAAAGATFTYLARLNHYLTDIAHTPQVLAVRDEFLRPDELPASTVVQVAALYRPTSSWRSTASRSCRTERDAGGRPLPRAPLRTVAVTAAVRVAGRHGWL